MIAYYKNDKATRERFDGDWIRSGDLAEADDSGTVRVLGRADDMLIVGGFNPQPVEVEDALRAHPAVVDVAVFGLPDNDLGEVPVAGVILRPGAREGEEDFVDACRERLARCKVP